MQGSRLRTAGRRRRHQRIRAKIKGAGTRPRLSVFRSLRHISAQLIDEQTGQTLVAASTAEGEVRQGLKSTSDLAAAQAVGRAVAERARGAGINTIVFDRSGYLYHGRVKALADAARAAGLEF